MNGFTFFFKFVLFLALVLAANSSARCAETSDDDPLKTIAADFAKTIQGNTAKIAIVGFAAQSGFEDAWSTGVTLARARLGAALGKIGKFEVISRDNLDSLQMESLQQGTPLNIKGVDFLVNASLLQVGRTLVVSATMVKVAGGRQETSISKVDPASLNVFLDDPDKRDIPPAESSIRMANSLMFDIARNHVKLSSCNFVLKEEKDADTILLMEKRKKVILSEMDQWSSTVLKELTKLRGIDDPIVRKSFHERKEYLISEGLLENVDTTRQRSLLERFRSLYQLAEVNGIEIENSKIIEACSETKVSR